MTDRFCFGRNLPTTYSEVRKYSLTKIKVAAAMRNPIMIMPEVMIIIRKIFLMTKVLNPYIIK